MAKRSAVPKRPRKRRHPFTWLVLGRIDQIRTARALRLFTPSGERANVVEIDREHGLADYHLSRIVRGQVGLAVDKLFEVLELLGENAAGFFAEVLGPSEVNALRLLEEIEAEHLRDVDPFPELGAGELPAPSRDEGAASPELEERLVRLDERRFVDPKAALPVALALWDELLERSTADPSRSTVELLCRCLGAIGSMARTQAGGFSAAARCLRLALAHAKRHRLAGAEADLLQRAAYLLSHKGRRQAAVMLALAAREEYLLAGNPVGVGKTLITLGRMQQPAGRPEQAARSFRAGLALIPAWDWWGRETAHEGLAMAALSTGRFLEAERELLMAIEVARQHPSALLDHLAWIGGEIALARGQNEEAAERFERARAEMGQRHPLEGGLLTLRLAIAYLRLGRQDELRRLAADLVGLLKPLAREPLAVEILTEVARAVIAGEVREQLLQRAAVRLWRGYPLLEKYPLQALA